MKIDWAKAKQEYVTSNKSMADIGAEFGVTTQAVKNRAKKEDWVSERSNYLSATYPKLVQKAEESVLNIADYGNKVTMLALQKLFDLTLQDIDNSQNVADRRIAIGNLRMLVETLHYPTRVKEANARIQKLNAETKSIEDGTQVDHDVTIRFENAEWMEDDDNSTNTDTKAD